MAELDHLVYAVPDLAEGVAELERRLGVVAEAGGRHVGLGTHNRLIGLRDGAYLEIVAPDPDQPAPARPRWFGLDDLERPSLVTWCVRVPALDEAIERTRAVGVELGRTVPGSRQRPDGSTLSWTFTDPWAKRAGGVVPFCIDWGAGPHPSDTLTVQATCTEVRVEHPNGGNVADALQAIGLDTWVAEGDAPRVIAVLDTPNGIVELT